MPVLKCGKMSENMAEQCRYHFSLWGVKHTRNVSLPVISWGWQNTAEKFRFHFSVHGAKVRQNGFAPTCSVLCVKTCQKFICPSSLFLWPEGAVKRLLRNL